MSRIGKSVIHAGLETLYFTGGYRLARPFLAGIGTILTFHRVRPAEPGGFQPNAPLEITPEFFDEVVTRLVADGFDLVTMDEVHRRISTGDHGNHFIALTFDDGYRDNRDYALPIIKRHGVPVTLFLPSSFADGTGDLWWIELERAVAASDSIEVMLDGEMRRFDTATDAEKNEAFTTIYWSLRGLPDEAHLWSACRELAIDAGIDVASICREHCMDWDELRDYAAEPLVTIGAHTESHIMLAKADADAARQDMETGARKIEEQLGFRPEHLSYPVGDPGSAGPREFALADELGFKTGVTTRPGVLFPSIAST